MDPSDLVRDSINTLPDIMTEAKTQGKKEMIEQSSRPLLELDNLFRPAKFDRSMMQSRKKFTSSEGSVPKAYTLGGNIEFILDNTSHDWLDINKCYFNHSLQFTDHNDAAVTKADTANTTSNLLALYNSISLYINDIFIQRVNKPYIMRYILTALQQSKQNILSKNSYETHWTKPGTNCYDSANINYSAAQAEVKYDLMTESGTSTTTAYTATGNGANPSVFTFNGDDGDAKTWILTKAEIATQRAIGAAYNRDSEGDVFSQQRHAYQVNANATNTCFVSLPLKDMFPVFANNNQHLIIPGINRLRVSFETRSGTNSYFISGDNNYKVVVNSLRMESVSYTPTVPLKLALEEHLKENPVAHVPFFQFNLRENAIERKSNSYNDTSHHAGVAYSVLLFHKNSDKDPLCFRPLTTDANNDPVAGEFIKTVLYDGIEFPHFYNKNPYANFSTNDIIAPFREYLDSTQRQGQFQDDALISHADFQSGPMFITKTNFSLQSEFNLDPRNKLIEIRLNYPAVPDVDNQDGTLYNVLLKEAIWEFNVKTGNSKILINPNA